MFVSRAPQAEIQGLKQRMGWEIPWYTITDDFDADHGVGEWHGTNAFLRQGDDVFRTYFIHDRGDEALGTMWSHLDMTAFGRQEEWEDSPEGTPQTAPYEWWNYHDAYGRERHDPRPRVRPSHRRALDRRGSGRRPGGRPRLDGGAPAPPAPGARLMQGKTLRIERTFDAPRQRVFEAWTSAEVMKRWFHAGHDWDTTEASVDLRVGGTVRVTMHNPHEGRGVRRRGRVHRDRPAAAAGLHLGVDDERDQYSQLIEIEFEERDGRTTVLFQPTTGSGTSRPSATTRMVGARPSPTSSASSRRSNPRKLRGGLVAPG